MGLKWGDKIRETTTVVGTGAATLLGAATQCFAFSSFLSDGDTTDYFIRAQSGSEEEWGVGTYSSSGNSITRTTVKGGSNGTSAVSFGTGTKDIYCFFPAWRATTVFAPQAANIVLAGPSSGGSAVPAYRALAAADIPALSYDALGAAAAAQAASQPLDADLTAIAALATTSFGRGGLTQVDAAGFRSYIGAGTGGGDALTANPLSQFATTTSAQLAGVISDETGTGKLVFATSPTLVTPVLGAATATTVNGLTFTTGTGTLSLSTFTLTVTATASVGGTNTGDQTITLTGDVTGSGTGSFAATLKNTGTAGTYGQVTTDAQGRVTAGATTDVGHGGTSLTTLTAHAVYVGNGASAPTALPVGATNTVLRGSTGADPAFGALVAADLPNTAVAAGSYTVTSLTVDAQGRITAASSGTAVPSGANPTATIGTTAVNGTAATFMRSDAAPAFGNLTSDVTSVGLVTTVAKVQGTTVSGTTGTGNVVFSASPTLTGTVAAASLTLAGTEVITSASANALAVGRQGATNPTLNADASAANCVTGINVVAAAAGAGVSLAVTSTATDESATLMAKGVGSLLIRHTADSGGYVIVGSQFPMQIGSDGVVGAHFGLRSATPGGGIACAGAGDIIPIQISSAGVTSFPSGTVNSGRSTIRWNSIFGQIADFSTSMTVGGAVRSGSSVPEIQFVTGADTALPLGVNLPFMCIGGSNANPPVSVTRQITAGALASWTEVLVTHPTLSATGVTTTTTAGTLVITNAPQLGPNMTITSSYALWVQAGNSFFGGNIILPVGAANSASLGFSGDVNTGLYHFAANVLGVTIGGTLRHAFANDVQTIGQFALASSIGSADVAFARVASKVAKISDMGSGLGWVQTAGRARLTADVTNATATMANLADDTITLIAGRKYTGRMVVKCVNSAATEGIQFDFNGGTATMTNFWAGAGILASGGTDVIGTNISTSLAGVINFTTFTGESIVVFEISMVCNAAGTFIPRFAENTSAVGTATVRLGSLLWQEDSPN